MQLRMWREPPSDLAYPDVYFTPGYGRSELGVGDGWATVCSSDGRWQVPLVLRRYSPAVLDASSPYGYSGVYAHDSLGPQAQEDHWLETKRILRDLGVASLFLRDSPLVSTYTPPEGEVVPVVRDHPTVAVPLGSEESMWAAMEGRARTTIRKARASGLRAEVVAPTTDDLRAGSAFRELYEGTMVRVGAAAQYFFDDEYYERLLTGLGGRMGLCRVSDAAGSVVAACLVLEHDDISHYHLSGSTPDSAKLGANALMIWELMVTARRGGSQRLMLGGGTGAGSSLLRFKQSFSRDVLAFNASGVVIDETLYGRAVDARCAGTALSAEELRASGFFPAYRAVP